MNCIVTKCLYELHEEDITAHFFFFFEYTIKKILTFLENIGILNAQRILLE